jgi:hypothetical protein
MNNSSMPFGPVPVAVLAAEISVSDRQIVD